MIIMADGGTIILHRHALSDLALNLGTIQAFIIGITGPRWQR
jgi:hypothetical protein